MIRRKIAIVVLSLGTVLGYASGFASLAHCRHHRDEGRQRFEQHVAQVCVDAARASAQRGQSASSQYAPPAPSAAAYGW